MELPMQKHFRITLSKRRRVRRSQNFCLHSLLILRGNYKFKKASGMKSQCSRMMKLLPYTASINQLKVHSSSYQACKRRIFSTISS